jgi:hypothetical protein
VRREPAPFTPARASAAITSCTLRSSRYPVRSARTRTRSRTDSPLGSSSRTSSASGRRYRSCRNWTDRGTVCSSRRIRSSRRKRTQDPRACRRLPTALPPHRRPRFRKSPMSRRRLRCPPLRRSLHRHPLLRARPSRLRRFRPRPPGARRSRSARVRRRRRRSDRTLRRRSLHPSQRRRTTRRGSHSSCTRRNRARPMKRARAP